MYCWGYGDGGWLGLPIEHGLPFVEPGPPTEKYGPTCSFDSDFNMLLPERVAALEGFKVQRVYGGGGHTVVLGVPRTEEERRAAKEQYQVGDLRGLGGGLAVGEPKDEDDSRYAQYKGERRDLMMGDVGTASETHAGGGSAVGCRVVESERWLQGP